MAKASANASAIWRDGRLVACSIFLIVTTAQPIRVASSAWVISSALRCCRIQSSNEVMGSIFVSRAMYLYLYPFAVLVVRCIFEGIPHSITT